MNVIIENWSKEVGHPMFTKMPTEEFHKETVPEQCKNRHRVDSGDAPHMRGKSLISLMSL